MVLRARELPTPSIGQPRRWSPSTSPGRRHADVSVLVDALTRQRVRRSRRQAPSPRPAQNECLTGPGAFVAVLEALPEQLGSPWVHVGNTPRQNALSRVHRRIRHQPHLHPEDLASRGDTAGPALPSAAASRGRPSAQSPTFRGLSRTRPRCAWVDAPPSERRARWRPPNAVPASRRAVRAE